MTLLEPILRIISSGAFPPPGSGRETLTAAQRRQLRDAMAFEAHHRADRDVFVTNDLKAFVSHGRRAELEQLCSTRILTVDEFITEVPSLASRMFRDHR